MNSPPSWTLLAFAYLGLCAVVWVASGIAFRTIRLLREEARTRDKRIEFASVGVAFLALLVAVASLAYSITQVDALSDRVTALEKAMKPASETQKPKAP